MDGEALGILSYSLPVGRPIVRVGIARVVDDIGYTVSLPAVFLNSIFAYVQFVNRDTIIQ